MTGLGYLGYIAARRGTDRLLQMTRRPGSISPRRLDDGAAFILASVSRTGTICFRRACVAYRGSLPAPTTAASLPGSSCGVPRSFCSLLRPELGGTSDGSHRYYARFGCKSRDSEAGFYDRAFAFPLRIFANVLFAVVRFGARTPLTPPPRITSAKRQLRQSSEINADEWRHRGTINKPDAFGCQLASAQNGAVAIGNFNHLQADHGRGCSRGAGPGGSAQRDIRTKMSRQEDGRHFDHRRTAAHFARDSRHHDAAGVAVSQIPARAPTSMSHCRGRWIRDLTPAALFQECNSRRAR